MDTTTKKRTSKPRALAIRSPEGVWSLPQVKRSEGLHPTGIGWCDFSANVIRAIDTETGKIGWHCDPQSPACANCYAEAINRIYGTGLEYRREHFDSGRVKIELDMQRINAILNYQNPKGLVGKAGDGRPKVFWNDMTDGAGEFVTDEMLDTMMAVVALRPDMDHLFLTKRVERLAAYLNGPERRSLVGKAACQIGLWKGPTKDWMRVDLSSGAMVPPWPLPNLWIGATVENQKQADIRIPKLRECPAAVRFVSVEPLLGELELELPEPRTLYTCKHCGEEYGEGEQGSFGRSPCCGKESDVAGIVESAAGVDWAILGCESDGKRTGRFADEYHDAAASVINQCRAASVAVFHKQWPHEGKVSTDLATLPERMRLRQWPKARVA